VGLRRDVVVGLIVLAGVTVLVGFGDDGGDRSGMATAAASATAPSGAPLPPRQRVRLAAAARAGLRSASTPGAVVAVQTPKGRWVRAIGIADTRTKAPMRADVHQRIGSVTKTFTGAVLMQLVGEGKLSLRDRIGKYIRGVPNGDKITLRQVAGMTSGVASYTKNPGFVAALFAPPSAGGCRARC
jgi:D-alanyl-D-alanine carboxypeptidase